MMMLRIPVPPTPIPTPMASLRFTSMTMSPFDCVIDSTGAGGAATPRLVTPAEETPTPAVLRADMRLGLVPVGARRVATPLVEEVVTATLTVTDATGAVAVAVVPKAPPTEVRSDVLFSAAATLGRT